MLIERGWRVAMADVDAAGVIYYGSPPRWAEMLLGDWLDGLGHSPAAGRRPPAVPGPAGA